MAKILGYSPQEVGSVLHGFSKNGSPALVSMAGRVLGFGDAEQAAITQGKVPFWLWLTVGAVSGALIGIQIQKRWPTKVPKILGGG